MSHLPSKKHKNFSLIATQNPNKGLFANKRQNLGKKNLNPQIQWIHTNYKWPINSYNSSRNIFKKMLTKPSLFPKWWSSCSGHGDSNKIFENKDITWCEISLKDKWRPRSEFTGIRVPLDHVTKMMEKETPASILPQRSTVNYLQTKIDLGEVWSQLKNLHEDSRTNNFENLHIKRKEKQLHLPASSQSHKGLASVSSLPETSKTETL